MGLIHQIKKYFQKRDLKNKLASINRATRVVNLREADSIGILFDANDRTHNKLINDYAEKLKYDGKKVNLLGYYEGSKEPTDLYFPYFYAKNINWKLLPGGDAVDIFLSREYDILINLTLNENEYLTYLAAISPAGFKVARYSDHHSHYHDMMMKTDEGTSLENLIDQIHYYLNQINKKQ